MLLTKSFAISILALTLAPAFAKRGVTPEDYFAFENISDAHISPDGKQVAYVVTTVDQKKNRRDTSIWMVDIDGQSAPRRLTTEGANSNSPRWSPDGSRLAFLSSRSTQPAETEPPHPQICILRTDGGEAQILTHLKNGVSAFQWSPDGKRFVAREPQRTQRQHAQRSQERRSPLHSHLLQIQRHRLVRRQADAPLDRRFQHRRRQAAHHRRRLERYRPAVVARFHTHRLRLRPHRQGIR